MSYILTA